MAYILAIGSALLYGAADFTGGLVARRVAAIPVVVISQAGGMVLLALSLPLLPEASLTQADLLWGAAAGLTGGIGVALLYHALAIGRMAMVAPTTAVCAVVIPVLVSILLGERPAPLAVAGISVGIVSIVLVSRHQVDGEPARNRNAGLGIAFASGVVIGFFFLTLAQTRPEGGLWPLLVARLVSVSLFATIALIGRRSLRMPPRAAALAVVGGTIDMMANVLYMLAAQQGPLSLVVTLSSLYPASTVLLARVILGERLNPWQLSGVGCALAAIVMIVSGG